MAKIPVFDSGSAATSQPLLVAHERSVLISFDCMKLLPARSILREGEISGRLSPGAAVIATSSGTFAWGLALECRRLGHPCLVVSDPAIDPRFGRLLHRAGARVEVLQKPAEIGGFQQARLDRVTELVASIPGAFVADQYGDPANPASYRELTEALLESTGPVDVLVATVGSGGSVSGCSKVLREANPNLHVIGIDTPGSVIFGCPDGPRLLRGLGNSIHPANVDHTVVDEVHWIDPATAFAATHELLSNYGLFQGPTSGAAYAIARWYAKHEPEARVLTILPDSGLRYLDSVFDDEWLEAHLSSSPCAEPLSVASPLEVEADRWSRCSWERRTLDTAGEQ